MKISRRAYEILLAVVFVVSMGLFYLIPWTHNFLMDRHPELTFFIMLILLFIGASIGGKE